MKKNLFLAILILWVNQGAAAQVFKSKTGHATFTSSVPLFTFHGNSDHLTGKVSLPDSIVDFYIDLTTLDTGIGKRDRDTRETLNTEKYPFASFYGKLMSSFDPSATTVQSATVQGEFKLHGITKNVQIDGTLQKKSEGLQVKASWIINIKDYHIKPPSLLFYKVDKNQKIEINALLNPVKN